MIWRRKRYGPDPQVEQAREQMEQALADLRAAQRDDSRVDELTRRMHEIRRTNRFADMMRRALRGIE